MVSQPYNTLIKFLKGSGRGPAQSINSLQVVKEGQSVLWLWMKQQAACMEASLWIWYWQWMLCCSIRIVWGEVNAPHTSQTLMHCKANLVKGGGGKQQRTSGSENLFIPLVHTASGYRAHCETQNYRIHLKWQGLLFPDYSFS